MKLAINLRTRAAALFAMLFLCFGMIGGFTGMANQEGAWLSLIHISEPTRH